MPSSTVTEPARRARALAQFGFPILLAAMLLPLIGQVYLTIFEPHSAVSADATFINVIVLLIETAPSLILAWAVLGASKVLSEYEHGRFLSLEASAHVRRVGQGALIALLLQFIAAPIVVAILRGEPLLGALRVDPFDIAVLMFATLMLTVGSVLEGAAKALKADNDQIV